MVLQETREFALVVEPGLQVFAHRPRLSHAQAIVEPLVIGVIKTLLLQGPFAVPVDLGHEAELRSPLSHVLDRRGPEWRRAKAPGLLEDVGQQEHSHVATHPVALSGDP